MSPRSWAAATLLCFVRTQKSVLLDTEAIWGAFASVHHSSFGIAGFFGNLWGVRSLYRNAIMVFVEDFCNFHFFPLCVCIFFQSYLENSKFQWLSQQAKYSESMKKTPACWMSFNSWEKLAEYQLKPCSWGKTNYLTWHLSRNKRNPQVSPGHQETQHI